MYDLLVFDKNDLLINDFRKFALQLYSEDIFWTKTNESYPFDVG